MSRAIKYDDDEFRRLWSSGAATRQIAERFGSSKSAVSVHVKRLGLKPRPYGRQAPMVIKDTQAFRDAWASKLSYAEIGKAMGCSADTVKRAGIRFCYPKRNLRRTAVPEPVALPPTRAGVRRDDSQVSLLAEPWSLKSGAHAEAPRARWQAEVARLAAHGFDAPIIAKKLICHEIDVRNELARCQVGGAGHV
ncbi:hypothetical protein [Yoonia sp. I 8.24]|uniref:hypothetical protein n=1 Tax=Yoonia sp. I 8.24 TaxID=1537229 RepID=UPI001EDF780F|nr:hypothetical protein [Yoonia sp. I 8.24]MCG3267762.1 hypothetical protein [Yoonia sp. I 8.24]